MENDASLSLSPMPPLFVSNIVYYGTLIPLVPTCSASWYTDSFADLEIAAIVKENDAIESHEKALEDNREELVSQKATFSRLERAFDKQKQHYEQILKSLIEYTRQKRIDECNFRDLKDTISDLR